MENERPAKMRKLDHENSHTPSIPTESKNENSDPMVLANPPKESSERTTGAATLESTTDVPMSKSQLKKQRKRLEWEAKKPAWKEHKKAKRVAKRQRQREARQQEQSGNGDVGTNDPSSSLTSSHPPRIDKSRQPKAVTLPITILIDCDFDDLMNDRERISLASQITRAYSDNGKSRFRVHLGVCSFTGHLRHRFDTVLPHYKAWKGFRYTEEDFVAAADRAQREWMNEKDVLAGAFDPSFHSTTPSQTRLQQAGEGDDVATKPAEGESDAQGGESPEKGETIYLTSESSYTLTRLKPNCTYIVGGLVDKNREKGICFRRATERNVKTARLPIGEFMEMTSRKVLATNHVVEIMLKWLQSGDWAAAFEAVIPKRKGGKLKNRGTDGDGKTEQDHDEEGQGEEGEGEDGEGEGGEEDEDKEDVEEGGVSVAGAED